MIRCTWTERFKFHLFIVLMLLVLVILSTQCVFYYEYAVCVCVCFLCMLFISHTYIIWYNVVFLLALFLYLFFFLFFIYFVVQNIWRDDWFHFVRIYTYMHTTCTILIVTQKSNNKIIHYNTNSWLLCSVLNQLTSKSVCVGIFFFFKFYIPMRSKMWWSNEVKKKPKLQTRSPYNKEYVKAA